MVWILTLWHEEEQKPWHYVCGTKQEASNLAGYITETSAGISLLKKVKVDSCYHVTKGHWAITHETHFYTGD